MRSENMAASEERGKELHVEECVVSDSTDCETRSSLTDRRPSENECDDPKEIASEEPDDDDAGWDETESLSRRLQSLESHDLQKADADPERTPSLSATSKQDSSEKGDEEGDVKVERTLERKEETQEKRPNIWKELERMHTSGRGGRGSCNSRFPKAAEKQSGGSDSWDEQPISEGRGRGGQGKWTGDTFERRSFKTGKTHDRLPITKGFDSIRSTEPRQKESPFSRDNRFPSDYNARNRRAAARGRGMVQGKGFSNIDAADSGARSRRPARPAFLDREVDEEEYDIDPDYGRKGDRAYPGRRQSRDHDDYEDEDEEPKGNERHNRQPTSANWLVDADDADLVDGYIRSRLHFARSARDTAFDPLIKALESFDHSHRSTKQSLALVMQLADDYCQNDSDRWLKLVDRYLMVYAIDRGGAHVEFVSTVFARCVDRSPFQKAAYISLMRHISELMAPHEWTEEEDRKAQNLCDLFGRLLVSSWPPGWDSCAKECNMVVYAIMNAVKTWLQALENTATRGAAVRASVAQTSAICLCHLTTTTGRKLWLKWPDFVDQMYATLRPVIVSRTSSLDEDAKLQLLDLYLKLNEWPKPVSRQATGNVPKRDAGTQTDGLVEGAADAWTPRPSAFDTVPPRGRGIGFAGVQHTRTPGFRQLRPDAADPLQNQRQQQVGGFQSRTFSGPRYSYFGK